MVTIDFQL